MSDQQPDTPDTGDAPFAALPPFDPAKYAAYVEEFDLTDDQEREFLRALWDIAVAFVRLGWGVDSINAYLPELQKLTTTFAANALELDRNACTPNFNGSALEGADKEGNHDK